MRIIRRKRYGINGKKAIAVSATAGNMEILWLSSEPNLIRVRRAEAPRERFLCPVVYPLVEMALMVANHESLIKEDSLQ